MQKTEQMMSREEAEELAPEALFCNGFDDAIIGVAERINLGPVIAYDEDKIIEILMEQMTPEPDDIDEGRTIEQVKYEMAIEYFEYNTKGAWVGEFTPIFVKTNN